MTNPTTYRDWLVNGMCSGHVSIWDAWDTSGHRLAWRMQALIRRACITGHNCSGRQVRYSRTDHDWDDQHTF